MRAIVSSLRFARPLDAAARWTAAVYALPISKRLAIAVAAVAAGALTRIALANWLDDRIPYATFYPAAEIAAVFGGLVPGLFASAASILLAHYWIVPQASAEGGLATLLFLTSCGLLSIVAELFHRTWLRLGESREQRKIAERLHVATQHFRVAVAAGAIGAWVLDLSRNATTASDQLRNIFGFGPDAIINPDSVYRMVLPEDAPAARAALQAALDPSGNGLYRAEYRIRRQTDQAIRWIATRGQTMFENGVPVRVVGVTRDVTDERTAARALLERTQIAEQFASVAAAAPGVVFSFHIGADNHIAYSHVSPKAKALFGIDADSICADARVFYRRVHVDDRPPLNAALTRSAQDMLHWDVDFRFDHPEKGEIWLEAQAAPVLQPNGEIVWHGYVSDATERKRFELSLAETAARLQATIDGARDAVITMDADGAIHSINRAGMAMFGYAPDELAGRNLALLVTGIDRLSETAHAQERLSPQECVDGRREVEGRRIDGRRFPAELTLSEARYDGKRLLVAFVKDLSEQRRIQERVQRLHSDRLEAMGGMAATLAHEINRPLAATATYLNVARRLLEKSQPPADASITGVIEKAAEQTLRAGRIVNSLRQLVTRGEPDKTLESAHELIQAAHTAMQSDASRSKVDVRIECRASNDMVVADRTQLKQVLVNLMRNAIEAMQHTEIRELTVSTSNPDDTLLRIDIADTGAGLAAVVEDDYFEPFTTTKMKGMGLGLSISRSIIEAHYGRIWAERKAGGGAVFSFTLPLQTTDVDA